MYTNELTMENQLHILNNEVTKFLDELNHPLRKEICEYPFSIILQKLKEIVFHRKSANR
jgi:hypothetical protein